MELNKLIAARGVAKATITRLFNLCQDGMALEKLKPILDQSSAEDIAKYEELYLSTLAIFEEALLPQASGKCMSMVSGAACEDGITGMHRLPPININKFSGENNEQQHLRLWQTAAKVMGVVQ
ncbi:uncharacterized protein LOC126382168 [Pectinophora gossypiella]|uniref:uncharacterized protein LOC126377247 n=1 Tax=Pectinophora gossypiella TaxID=13191 RepID=UPI00214E745E|nr:uncharacterized protein LOC126377247 [Pectinophora gossypiella]XP_049886609.1 uncharacterized protein LOC126381113 isoform X2 [Pectinophora gossypiella]XP_049886717.1 uncharacterized protein LOC126381264 isoform X2 [Pectinophora gossypiella]XP_049887907.1 uncharacterized protein LOC126382168 [Pectinophora gossypiella]